MHAVVRCFLAHSLLQGASLSFCLRNGVGSLTAGATALSSRGRCRPREQLFHVVRVRMVGARPQILPVVLQVKRDGLGIRGADTQTYALVARAPEKRQGVLLQLCTKAVPP